MLLGKAQPGTVETVGIQAGVDITAEGEQRLLGVVQAERGGPVHEAPVVQLGDFFAHPHQFANIVGAHGSRIVHQGGTALEKPRLGGSASGRRGLEIKCLGGRYNR